MYKNKILIIDDDNDLCRLLKSQLEKEQFLVTTCKDGEEGIYLFSKDSFSLVVLDIMLPKLNGFEVLLNLRKRSNVPVLMLTAKDSEIDKVSGLRLGADDYMTKPFLINEFLARVESQIRRYTIFSSKDEKQDSLSFKGINIKASSRQVLVSDVEIKLTSKEFDLLYFLATNSSRVYTKEQIYNNVWKEEYSFDDSNIMSFISKLRKKIKNEELGIDYIETVYGIGYRFSKEAQEK